MNSKHPYRKLEGRIETGSNDGLSGDPDVGLSGQTEFVGLAHDLNGFFASGVEQEDSGLGPGGLCEVIEAVNVDHGDDGLAVSTLRNVSNLFANHLKRRVFDVTCRTSQLIIRCYCYWCESGFIEGPTSRCADSLEVKHSLDVGTMDLTQIILRERFTVAKIYIARQIEHAGTVSQIWQKVDSNM